MESKRRSAHAVHFVGVGGIGMSALARYFLHLGKSARLSKKWAISGSDAAESSITKALRKEGVNVKIGHKKAYITPKVGLVIYNRAIPRDNPELIQAARLKIPAVPYAQVLGEITRGHATIAITGSHGKTTTTALAGLLLIKNKFDPTILIGSSLKEFGDKNIRVGKGPYLVLEADDFGGAFLEYSPKIAIVTNIDREHLDFYKTFGNLKNAFLKFLSRTDENGVMILNRDDKTLWSLRSRITAVARVKNIRIVWYSHRDTAARKIKKNLRIPGNHNLSNALAAYSLGHLLKIPEKNVLEALSSYRGAWRRMEYRGSLNGPRKQKIQVYDDYAHHPTEIKATLQAFREKFPRSPLICIFQPHQAKRLSALFKEFQNAFVGADSTIILPIYKVRGRDERDRYDSRKLVRAINHLHRKSDLSYLANPEKLGPTIKNIIGKSFGKQKTAPPVLVMMGAGDIVNFTEKLLKRRRHS